MGSSSRVRAYLAMSLDGYVAGPEHQLDWLTDARSADAPALAADEWGSVADAAVTYDEFVASVGCLLMGRTTLDVVMAMEGDWFYGGLRVLVATHRALDDAPPTVTAVSGSIHELVAAAQEIAGDGDVYLDGANLIRQALEAHRLDEIIATIVPTALGAGVSLFAGLSREHQFTVHQVSRYGGGLIQVRLTPGEAHEVSP
jgi:dihydrofolate reductase